MGEFQGGAAGWVEEEGGIRPRWKSWHGRRARERVVKEGLFSIMVTMT